MFTLVENSRSRYGCPYLCAAHNYSFESHDKMSLLRCDDSKINAIAIHPFGGVTTDAIVGKLPLDLSEHYRQISCSPDAVILKRRSV
jgi:hypothetical protein